jgi:hypothetical protein
MKWRREQEQERARELLQRYRTTGRLYRRILAPSLRAITRKPSCLISCSHSGPEGGRSVFVGRHGAINAADSGATGKFRNLRAAQAFVEFLSAVISYSMTLRAKKNL